MLTLDPQTKKQLIDLCEGRNIYLEGNILKLIDAGGDQAFEEYIQTAIEKDKDTRRKRLEITKRVQTQNNNLTRSQIENEQLMTELRDTLKNVGDSKAQIELQNDELLRWREENERISTELRDALIKTEQAKDSAESDLDIMQKKTQFELIGRIVKIALSIIVGTGIGVTIMYIAALYANKDTQMIGSTWSNIVSILLTNAFSIIGTIMGVKYASSKDE
jgi:hypothetical protein